MKHLRMIVENPVSVEHYLHNNFPYMPKVIDSNRRLRGDYFRKPTQYWFHNCEPTNLESSSIVKERKSIVQLSGHTGNVCDEDRSMISPDYARNFICDFVLGKRQPHTQLSLFDS